MRTNINYAISSDNTIYIKDGTSIYELKYYPKELFIKYWRELRSSEFDFQKEIEGKVRW